MTSILVAILALFPISFLAFALSERINAIQQTRVGKAISGSGFLRQTWINTCFDLRFLSNKVVLLICFLQSSILFFFDFNLEWVFLAFLITNGLITVLLSDGGLENAEQRIDSDRRQMRFLIGSLLAFLSAFTCFVVSGSTSLSEIVWSPVYLLFVPIFVVSGMILFSEYPFVGLARESRWIDSVRFYVWCALATQLFLGGGYFWIDLHLKALVLFVGFRLFAQYFPRYTQKDVFRLGVIYLIPIAVTLWLLVSIAHGVLTGGLGV